ncbi:ATP-dependent Clp protease proteolytic subunit [Ewingella americana]|uniref:ATP-dependent Clp protease proteolytic subunit n=1 Tax=Ewingella americana TaxID=41202 RepID=A0A377NE51_9GAMM|nr:ATP-dependent Clp protease proteolytic subunit [Ewingella americana]
MVHQPSGGFQGQATDIFIHAQNMQRTKSLMIKLYAEHCGRTTEEVERALDRDNFMTAEQAAEWGLIDRVLHHRQPAENLL